MILISSIIKGTLSGAGLETSDEHWILGCCLKLHDKRLCDEI